MNVWTMLQAKLLQILWRVRDVFTPSDFTKEMVKTEGRWSWTWVIFLVSLNFFSGVHSLFTSEYNEGFLYILVALLFALLFWDRLMTNVASALMKSMIATMKDQANLIEDLQATHPAYYTGKDMD